MMDEHARRRQARESFKNDALRAWKDYQLNGRHLMQTEVGAWLKTWGTPGETAMPIHTPDEPGTGYARARS
ncbi:hypothetical protein ACQ86O_27530 (plasmid) [Serratia sp. L9]|uniref:hypothetical protein n=1 Tax=Serratia sp. L9 TaxID=3423946 RepID=UPI003D67C054